MSSTTSRAARPLPDYPTIWGLDPIELHDRFWASRGVCIVRAGEAAPIPEQARLFLLCAADSLIMFDHQRVIGAVNGAGSPPLFVRLRGSSEISYREHVLSGEDGRFLKFERIYGRPPREMTRVALTRNRELAEGWRVLAEGAHPWKMLRPLRRKARGRAIVVDGHSYRRNDERDVSRFVRDLVERWREPSEVLSHVRAAAPGVWVCNGARLDPSVRFVGPAWVGAGRDFEPGQSVLGPTALWDDPRCRPQAAEARWDAGQSRPPLKPQKRRSRAALSIFHIGKRAFDIVFSIAALIFTLPLYPLIMLAIWWEDGRPFFYVHTRETLGGKPFPCLKFRSMRNNAELAKAELDQANQADGPQFYMPGDPRITQVGQKIRRCNIDELPQFINVLLGHMSIVGPRPSPYKENQCCPPWREARLSVRPGVTGLWQIMRTRDPGLDFQEWIRYDLQYVREQGWRMDFWIIFRTIRMLLRW